MLSTFKYSLGLTIILLQGLVLGQDTSRYFSPVQIHHIDSGAIVLAIPINPVYRLTSKEFNDLGSISAGDAAKFLPGVNIKDYGGIGGIQTISYRGLGGNHTLLSYNNTLQQDAQIGSINLNNHLLFGVQRLEFSAGEPLNKLTFASAFAPISVLDVKTITQYRPEKLKIGLSGTLNTINVYNEMLQLNLPFFKQWELNLSGGMRHGSGIYPFKYELAGGEDNLFREHSDLRQSCGRMGLIYRGKVSYLALNAYGNNANQNLPGAVILYNPQSDQTLRQKQLGTGVEYRHHFQKEWKLMASFNQHYRFTHYHDAYFLNQQGFYDAEYEQSNSHFAITVNKKMTQWKDVLGFGADLNYFNLKGSGFTEHPTRWQQTAFIRVGGKFKRTSLAFNLTEQFIQDFHGNAGANNYFKLSPFAGFSHYLNASGNVKLRGFYKNAYRLPTLTELYYNYMGNNGLKPEDATIYNLGLVWKDAFKGVKFQFSGDVHYTTTKNKIVAIPNKDLFNWTVVNVGESATAGLDLHAFIQFNWKGIQWNASTSQTIQRAREITHESYWETETPIAYVPDYIANYQLSIRYKNLGFTGALLYNGARFTLQEVTASNFLTGFTDINLGIDRNFNWSEQRLNLSFKVMNLLNKNYEIIRSYPMPGRYFQVRLNYFINE